MKSIFLSLAIITMFILTGCNGAGQPAPTPEATNAKPAAPSEYYLYVGTYTRGDSKGIYIYRMDFETAALTPVGVEELSNPSFLALHPSGKYLYAVNENAKFREQNSGAVTAFAIEPHTGKLDQLNQQPSGGGGPCHLAVDKTGRVVLVANYGGGSITALPIAEDGSLDPATSFVQHRGSSVHQRQKAPHAHWIDVDPANKHVLCADLGLDKVMVYDVDAATGQLSPNDPPAGETQPAAGPRHFAFHPTGEFGYVINEIDSTLTAYRYDAATGALTEIHTVPTLPKDFDGNNSTAELVMHPSGRFLYGSNRGHDSIAVFRVDQQTGRLTAVGHTKTQGKTPRSFGIDPTGAYLVALNQQSDSIVIFRIDPATGTLSDTGVKVDNPTPVSVVFRAKK